MPNVDRTLLAGSIVAAASHPPATYQFKHSTAKRALGAENPKVKIVDLNSMVDSSFVKAAAARLQIEQ